MRYGSFVAILLFLLPFLEGCSGEPPAEITELGDLPRERVEFVSEWRDAWKIEASGGIEIPMEAPADGAILRLGILREDESAGPIHSRVRVGSDVEEHLVAAQKTGWEDLRLDLSAYAVDGAEWRIRFDADTAFWLSTCEWATPVAGRPNVLVYLVDTLRQDHLGVYGYDRPTSPNLDEFAKDAVTLTGLVPSSSWTRPSVASLLTSTYPSVHGAQDRTDIMRPDMPTLAEAFAGAGYETQGFIANPNVLPEWGFGYEFDRYRSFVLAHDFHQVTAPDGRVGIAETVDMKDDGEVVEAVLDAIRNAADRPWFFYVHTMAPHSPYAPPEPYRSMFERDSYAGDAYQARIARNLDLYDGEIAYSDALFGNLLDELRTLGLYDNTAIVFLSDHGEAFEEHGLPEHGNSLYEELLRIPCIVKLPDGGYAGERRTGLLEIVDIAPTMLDLAGVDSAPRFEGVSMVDLLRAESNGKPMAFSSLRNNAHSLRSAKSASVKFIHDLAAAGTAWFDLERDPTESRPLPSPIGEGDRLRAYASSIAMRGTAGLHVLVTASLDASLIVKGKVTATRIADAELRYHPDLYSLNRSGESVGFLIQMRDTSQAGGGAWLWDQLKRGGARNFAHLRVALDSLDDVAITLTVNGQIVPENGVRLGSGATARPLDGAAIPLADLLANPDSFDPSSLPQRFGVYCWYVAEADRIADEDLSPEMRESLRALGYID